MNLIFNITAVHLWFLVAMPSITSWFQKTLFLKSFSLKKTLRLPSKDGKTKIEQKEEQKKKLSTIKEELKTAGKFAGAETLKTYELFCYFMLAKCKHNEKRLSKKCTARTAG
jgi:hypothetical protein